MFVYEGHMRAYSVTEGRWRKVRASYLCQKALRARRIAYQSTAAYASQVVSLRLEGNFVVAVVKDCLWMTLCSVNIIPVMVTKKWLL